MARHGFGAVALAAVVLVVGCSRAPKPGDDLAAGDTATTVAAPGVVDSAPDPGLTTDPTAPGASTGPGAATTIGGRPGSVKGGTATGPGAGGPAATSSPGVAPAIPGLFSAKEDRVGITDTSIALCAHAALTYGAAFNTGEKDLNVYWTSVNESGGVYGRKVNVTYVNDNYTSDTAIQAATTCRDTYHPFAILGGIGFDQIPGVRDWAEKNHELYIHHTATENGANNLKYSYTFLPTTERTGQLFGDLAATRFAGKKVGILKRDSANWEPGINGFKQVAKARGVKITLERAVAQNKGSYVQDLIDLRDAGSDVVFIWLNALETTQVMLQMKGQAWNPNVMIFPFNLVSQKVGDAALNPPITGVGMYQAYSFGDRSGSFASYADDLNQFEAQYAKYDSGADLHGLGGDLLFLNWSAQKAFHKILLDCGKSCGRNELIQLISTYKKKPTSSACSIDFTRPGPGNSHRGGYALSVMQAYKAPDGNVNFRNTNTCVESL
jgi:ABC-type branched-subunit amino acid transport system substrate-binding protein